MTVTMAIFRSHLSPPDAGGLTVCRHCRNLFTSGIFPATLCSMIVAVSPILQRWKLRRRPSGSCSVTVMWRGEAGYKPRHLGSGAHLHNTWPILASHTAQYLYRWTNELLSRFTVYKATQGNQGRRGHSHPHELWEVCCAWWWHCDRPVVLITSISSINIFQLGHQIHFYNCADTWE